MKFHTLADLTAAASLAFGAAAVAQDRSDWPNSMTIGTASQGGSYFVYGNGFASYIAETLGIAAGHFTGCGDAESFGDIACKAITVDEIGATLAGGADCHAVGPIGTVLRDSCSTKRKA